VGQLKIDAAKLPVNEILKNWQDLERTRKDKENATNWDHF
jgi:hypothetical protein